MKKLIIVAIALLILVWSFVPAWAKAQGEARSYLDLETLQEKVANLVEDPGQTRIDLSNLIIDLSNPESSFNQEFYRAINNVVGRGSSPVGLDFSNSLIQGNLQLNRLGISSTVGEGALPAFFSPGEQKQIQQAYPVNNRDRPRPRINIFRGGLNLTKVVVTGEIQGDNSLFLQPVIAIAARFQQAVNLSQDIFVEELDLSQVSFEQNFNGDRLHFFAPSKFETVEFGGTADFSQSQFEGVSEYEGAIFNGLADFTRTVYLQPVDFSRVIFRDRSLFAKAKFLEKLVLRDTIFDKVVTFRDIYLNSLLDLQDAHLLDRLDFSNGFFSPQARINTSGLAFDSTEAKIIGESGIGKLIYVNRLASNETVLRNLIRNFRSLEQIADANYLEYQREQLRLGEIGDRLTKTSYRKVFTWEWISLIPIWIALNLLLLLGDYGTNINLLFAIGALAIAFFSCLYWLIDRYRPGISQPILPRREEITVMLGSYLIITSLATVNVFITTSRPWLTLGSIAIILLPIPLSIVSIIYQRGRYHNLLDTTYFVEDGSMREFRLLLGRLPIMPRFPFFRDRYQPILWDRRWNWLNYYDLSLNNIFKIGFNDIRLRDRHLPGLISTLVWYQWCLGVFYIILLLWTLSRTIPGLNLLIYF